MWTEVVRHFACPECRGGLVRSLDVLRCENCGRDWRVTHGVPRLLPGTSTTDLKTIRTFEHQWRAYSALPRLFGKDRGGMAANLVGDRLSRRIDRAWYRGKRVLDAGCGHGRYLGLFRAMGARVVGLDAGRGPEAAGVPLDEEGIAVVQGSVLALPFRDETFDLVFCDGVLHHTSDPEGAYRELARVVRPGGALYVWVYPREGRLREAFFGAARAVTTRLPSPLMRGAAFFLAPLTLAVRSYSGTRLGRSTWAECAQVVHDWLAPGLQSHHTGEEVRGWALAAGLADPERLPVPVGVTAWKPARPVGPPGNSPTSA